MNVVYVISGSQTIEIESFSTGQSALINRDNSLCEQIISFLQASFVRKVTPKVVIVDGITQSAIAAYKQDLFLYFDQGNGSLVKLDLVGNTIWYEDEFSIYEVDINLNMSSIVNNYLLTQSNLPFEIKLHQQGVELSITLSNQNIKSGQALTINATLKNINNTNKITFIKLKDDISVKVWDSHSLVYNNIMYILGATTILGPGQKISGIFKWDTSENILSGDKPPTPGKYVIQISASIPELGSGSKIALQTDYIEIILTN